MDKKQEFSQQTIAKINKVIDIAYAHDGKIFGGYVRDVIIPRLKDPSRKVYFKDVDIWFADKSKADEFINAMQHKYQIVHMLRHDIKEKDVIYPFTREQYHLSKNGKCLAWFDVVISDKFPVNDFDVNNFYYFKGQLTLGNFGYNAAKLIDAIHRKEMKITPEYYQKATKIRDSMDYTSVMCTSRIFSRYLNNGWSIIYNGKILKLEMIKDKRILGGSTYIECFHTIFKRYAQPLSKGVNIIVGDGCGTNSNALSGISGFTNTSTNPNELSGIIGSAKAEVIKIGSSPCKESNTGNSLSDLAKASEDYRKAAENWNNKLKEFVTDEKIVTKYSVQVTEQSLFEYLLTK